MLAITVQAISDNLTIAISVLLGIYEVVIRAIPTVKDFTLVGNVVKALTFISNSLNVIKPAETPTTPAA